MVKTEIVTNITCILIKLHIPDDCINNFSLKQQVSRRQKIITDKILIGSYCYVVTYAQWAQHLQHLKKIISHWEGGAIIQGHKFLQNMLWNKSIPI